MFLPIGALLENDIWHFVEVADDDLRIVHTVAVEFLLVYVSAVVFDADGGPLHAVGPEEIFGGVVADVVKLSGLRKFFCDDVESSAVGLFGADFFGDGDVFVENKAVETEGFDFVSLRPSVMRQSTASSPARFSSVSSVVRLSAISGL